jgi:hypothetical protein
MGYYPHFILAMRRSRGFASTASNFVALFRLAFASAPRQYRLTSLETVSRRIIMQKARRHPSRKDEGRRMKDEPAASVCVVFILPPSAFILPVDGLRPLVGMWFQVQYPPLVGVLPIFRSRYLLRYRSPAST